MTEVAPERASHARSRSRSPTTAHKPRPWLQSGCTLRPLRGTFGALVEPEEVVGDTWIARVVGDAALAEALVQAWRDYGGLLVLRGLTGLSPEDFVSLSKHFGELELDLDQSKQKYKVGDVDGVMRLGNTRDASGSLTAAFAVDAPLPPSGSPQYREADRKPVWHTDQTYREQPPVGSLLLCRQAPPEGAATCWADTHSAFEALDEATRERLERLECVCSLAHHDAKVHKYSPDYPVLTPEQRAANPPRRVPAVLRHPLTGRRALYGVNSSTCEVVPKGARVSQEQMDRYDLEAVEHPSVERELRSILPFVTSDRFTVKWQWSPGDVVVWDNRCTIHCATGFDATKHTREMWRTTLAADLSTDRPRAADSPS